MIAFIALAALLIACALLFVVPALVSRRRRSGVLRSHINAAVYRDQLRELDSDLSAGTLAPDQYDKARSELESRVLQDLGEGEAIEAAPSRSRWTATAAGIAVPVLAIGLYIAVGNPQALLPDARSAAAPQITEQQVVDMVERLAARLKEKPEDGEGWMMLGRAYSVLGRFPEAARAYANAVERKPNDAQLLADYADAVAMAQGQRLEGEPEKIIARALEVDPDNVKALALKGTVSFGKKDYADAVKHWERILKVVPPDSEVASSVASSINEAKSLAGGGAAAEPTAAAASTDAGRVSGVVKLAPQLASKVAPTDIVFIYARAADGPRIPLAVVRRPAGELPVQFTLDDTMAMAPDMKLSSFPKVIVSARISKSGNAQPQPGDLQGASGAIGNGASGVTIVIDSEVH
jgi:cytochrome c-type biogenesis protein CcmH